MMVHAPSRKREKHEIKMFFDRETPSLRDRSTEVILQVCHVLEKKCIPRMPAGQHMENNQNVIRGPDTEHPSHDKAARVDMTRFSVLPKQQASDEKAAQCEEEIDALSSKVLEWILDNLKEYIVGMNSVKVKAHHRNDCDATNEVQFDRTSGFRGSRPAK